LAQVVGRAREEEIVGFSGSHGLEEEGEEEGEEAEEEESDMRDTRSQVMTDPREWPISDISPPKLGFRLL